MEQEWNKSNSNNESSHWNGERRQVKSERRVRLAKWILATKRVLSRLGQANQPPRRDNFFSSIAISILPGYDTTNYFVKSFCCVAIRTSSYEIQILIQVGSVSESWMEHFIRRVEASDNLKLTGQSWHCLPVNCKRSNRSFSGPKMSEVGHEFMTLCREESGGSNYSCTSQQMPVKEEAI